MGFLNNFFASKVNPTFENEAERVVQVCKSYGPIERGELKVCMLMALATFAADAQKTGDETIFKILETMDSGTPPDSAELEMQSTYTMKLIEAQKQAHASPSPIVKLVAAGIPVWIVSIRALSHAAVLPHARQLWSILQDSDALTVYDRIGEIASRLGSEPVVDILLRIRSTFSTPQLFNPR